jgi:hypothetical protein
MLPSEQRKRRRVGWIRVKKKGESSECIIHIIMLLCVGTLLDYMGQGFNTVT